MRDPDLVGRAQRAAIELERAWDRWRTMHGLGREPMPAVSSYVGYSLEEPWGQPRVVFGIEAREAEQLAALLDRHDCAGPVYAGLASMPGGRAEESPEYLGAPTDRRRVIVPSQSQGGVAEREAAWREATWREPVPREPVIEHSPPQPYRSIEVPAQQTPVARAAAEALEAPMEQEEELPEDDELDQPEDQDPDDGEAQLAAFRPHPEPEAQAADEDEAFAEQEEEARVTGNDPGLPLEGEEGASRWRRPGRIARGRAAPRQKRASGASRTGASRDEGKARVCGCATASMLSGWAAGELPGQASHSGWPACLPGRAAQG